MAGSGSDRLAHGQVLDIDSSPSMIEVADALAHSSGLQDVRVWGENADRYFPDAPSMVRWLDQPSLVPFLPRVSEEHGLAFRQHVVDRMVQARVRKLADEIIQSQRREIAEMKALIADIEANGKQAGSAAGATQMLLGPKVPPPDASAVKVPEGFRAEVVLSGLTYPTSVEFDDGGALYIAEAGYS